MEVLIELLVQLCLSDGNNPTPPPAQVSCPDGFTPYWYECFKLHQNRIEWAQANEECESQLTTLPSIHTFAENAVLHLMVMETGVPVWLGLYKSEVCTSLFQTHFHDSE